MSLCPSLLFQHLSNPFFFYFYVLFCNLISFFSFLFLFFSSLKQVYIVGHMPPGTDERQMGLLPNGHTTFSEKNNLRYLQLVRKYSSIILGQFFGHLHSDSFRIVYNNGKLKLFYHNMQK